MKSKFAKLFAALALLLLVASPLVGDPTPSGDEVVDVLNREFTGVIGTNYTEWSGKTGTSGAVYAGQSAGGNESIQLRSSNSNSGIVTTTSGGKVTKVTVTWNSNTASSRTLNVYGKNTAYQAATDLYNSTRQGTLLGTIVCGTSTELTITGDFAYIGLRSSSGAMYLTEIDIVWETTPASTDPICTVNPTEWDFGEVVVGQSATKTFTVTTANLTSDLAVSLYMEENAYSVSPSTISQTATTTEVTVTFTPTALGVVEELLNFAGGGLEDDLDVSLTGTGACVAPSTALAFTTPVDLVFDENEGVTYELNPTPGTGNGGTLTYALITNPDDNAEITDGNTFYAIGRGTYVVRATQAANGTTCGGIFDITINVVGDQQTITFNAGSGSCATPTLTAPQGSIITLPTATPSAACAEAGWTFVGWATAAIDETQPAPTLLNGDYTVNGDATLYAVYTLTNSVVFDFATIAQQNGWTNGTAYTTVEISPITITANGGGNNGKYYTSNSTWRMYNGGSVSITTSTGAITAVSSVPSSTFTISGGSASLSITSLTEFKSITVTYSEGATYNSNPTCIEHVAMPAFSPEAGTYTSAQNVSIACATSGATVYYTTDGTTPTTESTQYTDAIAVAANMTIKAIAVKEGMIDSEVTTAEYIILTIVHAGTAADPYTVADARAAIDANVGVENVYATGVVSAIVTAYNEQFHNITFDMVDEAGNSTFLRAYRCGDEQAADVQVGDIAVVSGNLVLYGSTYEFAQGCQLVSLTHPQNPSITLNTYNINATAARTEGTLTVTYNNMTEVEAEVYLCDADGQAATYDWIEAEIDEDNNNVLSYTIAANDGEARTAYFKVFALYDQSDEVYSNLVTITQAAYEIDYATLPFSFDGGHSAVATTTGLTQNGIGESYGSSPKLKFDSTGDYLILKINERPGELAFDIKGNSFSNGTFKVQTSSDGVAYTDLASFTALESTTQHKTYNNLAADVRYIKWVYTEKVDGNVALGNITLAQYTAPTLFTLSIANPNNVAIIAYNDNIQGNITNGEQAQVFSGSLVTLDVRPGADYVLDEIVVTDAEQNTHTVEPLENGLWGFYMPSLDVTVNAVAIASHAPVTYALATTIESGRHYIIVGENSGVYYAMGVQKTNTNQQQTNRAAKPVSIDGTTATVTRSDVFEFTIADAGEGVYSIEDDVDGGYLAAGSSNSNMLVTNEEVTDESTWAITFDATTGEATLVAQGNYSRNHIQFNHTSGLFSCYGEGNDQHPVYLYVKEDGFQLDINGYLGLQGEKDNYYLIASPVAVDPANVAGMTDGNFDLYYYDQNQTLEWINWKGDPSLNQPGHFNLIPGTGYLYAKKATNETPSYSFNLSGELYSGNANFSLVDGWNLLGNPYAYATTIDVGEYAVMNDDHNEIIAGESFEIQPLQGVFIWGESGSSVTFSRAAKSAGAKQAGIVLNLSKVRGGVADRVIVRFGEGRQMPKFQLSDNTPKLYVTQDGKSFSVMRSAYANEIPVNFEAADDGTYTLSVKVDNLELDYLHLVDNLTGADVDLLLTPSYTFTASTTDSATRFRLVFSAVAENEQGK